MPPNVILITTHDTGRHLGCYGVETFHTPNLDRLAGEGCRFTSYFTTSPLCSPSRGAMMTGRYPQTNGMLGLCHEPWNWKLNDGERHLSHLLHDAGYYTILLGHQHETTDVDAQLCFDRNDLYRDPATGAHTTCETVAEGVAEFLTGDAADRAPFYLQVGFFETHRPFGFGGAEPDAENGVYVPPFLQDNEAARRDFAAYQGNIRKMDAAVGSVLDALEASGLEEDTLVIYTVDHGIPFPRAKATLYDPGLAIALIMRRPGVIDAGTTCDWLLSNVDFAPTLLDLAGVPVPETMEGRSFAAALRGDGEPTRKYAFASQVSTGSANEIRCVRTDRYKLIRNFAPCRKLATPVDITERPTAGSCPYVQLFDLKNDPLEFNDLAGDPAHAEIVGTLDDRLFAWLQEVDDPVLRGPVPTPYYEEAIAPYRRRLSR